MDPLEEQLMKLKIINCRDLSSPPSTATTMGIATTTSSTPTTHLVGQKGKVAALVNSLQNRSTLHMDLSPKKVGPVVPPKPIKRNDEFPQVPRSSRVEQVCEPLYSQRLQNSNSFKTKSDAQVIGRPSILLRKQPIYATEDGGTSSKVTLDNPAILEQQLEALTHHKKELEKRGLLQQSMKKADQQKSHIDAYDCIPKLSSTSLIKDSHSKSSQHRQHSDRGSAVYANSAAKVNEINRNRTPIYSNVLYPLKGSNVINFVEASPSPLLSDTTETLNENNDDENLSPPSPVSSSYSELLRATSGGVFSKTTTSAGPNKAFTNETGVNNEIGSEEDRNYNPNCIDDAASGGDAILEDKAYMNLNYLCKDNYDNYSSSVQSVIQDSSDYYGYGNFSQNSSTYESIYEPINPRPPSQLSQRSTNYVAYSPFMRPGSLEESEVASNGSSVGVAAGILSNSCSSNFSSLGTITSSKSTNAQMYFCGSGNSSDMNTSRQECEVEALTDYLVHSMDPTTDVDDSYGICFKCNERVLGESTGCTAMDQIYHIACFTCAQCQINLQGKPFYALEGKPLCEYDYLQTLEKCSVCMKPILERILRATGKPYHPQCFTCVVCGNSLDGIPFTVDATNQNYCIADFHKKFAPRCCVCKAPIMPAPGEDETIRVVALDRSFHLECYKCEDCGLLLSSEAEGRGCYPLDDHVLCKSCNAKRVQALTDRMTTEL